MKLISMENVDMPESQIISQPLAVDTARASDLPRVVDIRSLNRSLSKHRNPTVSADELSDFRYQLSAVRSVVNGLIERMDAIK